VHRFSVSSHRLSEIRFKRENRCALALATKNKNAKQHDRRRRRDTKRGIEKEREGVTDQTNAVDAKTHELWTLSLVVKVSHFLGFYQTLFRCASLRGAESDSVANGEIFSVSSRKHV